MPKANNYPLSVLFAINKPSGPPSMTVLNKLQPLFSSSILFKDPNGGGGGGGGGKGKGKWNKKGGGRGREERIKIGQGGTLDPLADGVLVVGTNAATKHLAQFLDCTKEYRAVGIFGCATDSYDSEGKKVKLSPFEHITKEKLEEVLHQFRGQIKQVPPIFSALKMDGKPLYEYARSGTPLPRPIAARDATVSELTLLRYTKGAEHKYTYPTAELGETEKIELAKLQKMVQDGATAIEKEDEEARRALTPEFESKDQPPIFEISMTVSSGTYVRSIIHDIGIALGSSAHLVQLTRTRQGIFTLNDNPSLPIVELGSEVSADNVVVASEEVVDIVSEVVEASSSTLPSTSTSASEITPVEPESSSVLPVAPVVSVSEPVVEFFAGGCVEWEILEDAIKALEESRKSGIEQFKNEDGFLPWEVEILHRCKAI